MGYGTAKGTQRTQMGRHPPEALGQQKMSLEAQVFHYFTKETEGAEISHPTNSSDSSLTRLASTQRKGATPADLPRTTAGAVWR